jgi:hypothetical protein
VHCARSLGISHLILEIDKRSDEFVRGRIKCGHSRCSRTMPLICSGSEAVVGPLRKGEKGLIKRRVFPCQRRKNSAKRGLVAPGGVAGGSFACKDDRPLLYAPRVAAQASQQPQPVEHRADAGDSPCKVYLSMRAG